MGQTSKALHLGDVGSCHDSITNWLCDLQHHLTQYHRDSLLSETQFPSLKYKRIKLLGWYKSNCSFELLEVCCLILEYILNVVMLYTILMCISHYMFFGNDLLLAIYFIFILD